MRRDDSYDGFNVKMCHYSTGISAEIERGIHQRITSEGYGSSSDFARRTYDEHHKGAGFDEEEFKRQVKSEVEDSFSSTVLAFENMVRDLSDKVDEMQEDLSDNEKDINSLKVNLENANKEILSLKDSICELQDKNKDLKLRMSFYEEEVLSEKANKRKKAKRVGKNHFQDKIKTTPETMIARASRALMKLPSN